MMGVGDLTLPACHCGLKKGSPDKDSLPRCIVRLFPSIEP